ncbi:MAG: 50S ribosomal protein L3 [Planctomycetes bacterium]|nr:50S ribosomal protein L3 [Planctomycetota bacterium]MBI3843695.1 50S ribosomal protein L3 [Planctomycetota bacterium]
MTSAMIVGRKLGMNSIFDETGTQVPVTVIEAGPCRVVQVKTKEKDGYEAVKIGFLPKKPRRTRKPQLGEFKKANLEPMQHLHELRMPVGELKAGDEIKVDQFAKGDIVTIIGTSKGKGFQGVVRRHHFSGGPKTHGQSDRHRAPGSIGSSAFPSRVIKGVRMGGHMGNARRTIKNQLVAEVLPEQNIILVRGGVPGPIKGIVQIKRVRGPKTKTEG